MPKSQTPNVKYDSISLFKSEKSNSETYVKIGYKSEYKTFLYIINE